jgi:hypothetical protein
MLLSLELLDDKQDSKPFLMVFLGLEALKQEYIR